jgi:hypothetical protein
MPVTFSNFTPANIGANFMAGRKEAQDMETGRLQQQEARMKLDDFQRKQAGLDQFLVDYEKHGQTGDPEFLAGNLLKYAVSQRNPELITQARTLLQTAQQRKKFNAMQNPNQLAGAARPVAPAGELGSGTFDPNAPAPTNALAPMAAPSVMTPSNAFAPRAAAPAAPAKTDRVAEIEKRLSFLNEFRDLPDAKDEATRLVKEYERLTTPVTVASGSSIYNPQTQTFTQAPERVDTDLIRNYNAAKNQGFVGSILEYQQKIAAAGRAPATPATPSAPVAVVGPDGTPILVSREEALRGRMTPANTAEKPMTQAQRVKYTKDKVSDKNVVTGAFAVTGELEKLTDELVGNPDKKIAPAPGLSSITGFSALTNPLALPSGDARKALQKLETFKGKIMALGRQLASQEGKLGNMAVQEWKFVSDAVQKIDPAAGNLDEQMRDVVRQAREYAQRQQSKYDDNYADDLTTQGSKTAPAAGGPKVVDFGSLK